MATRRRKTLRPQDCGRGEEIVTPADETTDREQVVRASVVPEADSLAEQRKKAQITLRSGAIVNAREAVAIVAQLEKAMESRPDEFKTLLALAENRPQDADRQHFDELQAEAFLQNDRSIDPVVRDVLLTCYHVTPEGPVIVPLRLKDAGDLPAAEEAQNRMERQVRKLLRKPKSDEGPSIA